MKIIECQQGSREWLALRQHRLTGSRLHVVLNGTARGWSSLAHDMRAKPSSGPSAAPLRWGRENEPAARATYQLQAGVTVRKVGFVVGTDERFGCSPDGLVGRSGLVEIKCPYNPDRHAVTLRLRRVPDEYVAQVQGQMWIAERKWCDYVSFDPREFNKNRIVVLRVERDDQYIAHLAERCALFLQLYAERKDPLVWLQKYAPRFF